MIRMIENKRNPNKITLVAYGKEASIYLKTSSAIFNGPMLRWIDAALALTPHRGRVLEIGSAMQRDAHYMRSKGYYVQCSDAVPEFIEDLANHGENAVHLNILTDELPEGYDLIFANAVLPHFTKSDFVITLRKVYYTLRPGDLFAFSVKQGFGAKWVVEKIRSKRYISYWQPEPLIEVLKEIGFTIPFMEHDLPGNVKGHVWINVIVQKDR